mmetsp:Transcript_88163/g.175027  ORF Transcript_88163/g.175027 Transcript_88163/m.175027 type:complete len:216 (-) Transcript_88163:64-711(-)
MGAQVTACSSPASWQNPPVSCGAGHCRNPDELCSNLEDSVAYAIGTAKRGGVGISDEEMADHELLQCARRGDAAGVADALRRGALVEARRPLAMRPREDMGRPYNDAEDCGDDSVGMTPLMYASQSGVEDCVRRLIERGAHVNAVDEDLWTAMHFAAKEGHLTVCSALLRARADPSVVNCDDKTPLKLAQEEVEDRNFVSGLDRAIRLRQRGTSL